MKPQKPQPNPSLWLSKSEIDKMLADERAKTLKEIGDIVDLLLIANQRRTSVELHELRRYVEAELKTTKTNRLEASAEKLEGKHG